MYKGRDIKEIIDMYREIEGKVPGLKQRVNATLQTDPEATYDTILTAHKNYMAAQKGEERQGPGILTSNIFNLEIAIRSAFDTLRGGPYSGASHESQTKPKAKVAPFSKKGEPNKNYKAPAEKIAA
jgi:hypothetical protein